MIATAGIHVIRKIPSFMITTAGIHVVRKKPVKFRCRQRRRRTHRHGSWKVPARVLRPIVHIGDPTCFLYSVGRHCISPVNRMFTYPRKECIANFFNRDSILAEPENFLN
jgi:hypothetical protein